LLCLFFIFKSVISVIQHQFLKINM